MYEYTYGVYPEKVDGLKRNYEKLWREVSKMLRKVSNLVIKQGEGGRLPLCGLVTLFLNYIPLCLHED